MLPRCLDLYCGAGGATRGYQLAGFHVTGVDLEPQPRYCGDAFIQEDAIGYLDKHGHEFDAIHASPPCQRYSSLKTAWPDREYPDLIGDTRQMFQSTDRPYVIENVVGAPLRSPIVLCGSMFPALQVRRHRLFECSFNVPQPACRHQLRGRAVPVYGHTGAGANSGRERSHGRSNTVADWRTAMGIEWMTAAELTQAIPPAYTEFLGTKLMESL